jgi:hypothetical protein
VVAFTNGFGGAWWLGEAVRAVVAGREPAELDLTPDEPLMDDGSCPPEWQGFTGRFRAHNPWLPTFLVAAREDRLVLGTDWTDGSERLRLTPLGNAIFRVGDDEWSPERLCCDTVIGGRAQRAVLSGTPYYRAFDGSQAAPTTPASRSTAVSSSASSRWLNESRSAFAPSSPTWKGGPGT